METKHLVIAKIKGQVVRKTVTLIQGYTTRESVPNILAVAHGVDASDVIVYDISDPR